MVPFFRHGRPVIWLLVVGILLAIGLSIKLLTDTAQLRYERDVNRMVFNDNLGVLENIRAKLGIENDSMQQLMQTPGDSGQAYLVVSIADKQLWYKRRDSVLFEAPVATASGKVLVSGSSGRRWRFETPRGRLPVIEKEEEPAWVPPDWHYIEYAHKKGLGTVRMERGQTLTQSDGSQYTVRGNSIVRITPDGATEPLDSAKAGRELVVNGNVVIPPFGTIQRRYAGTLGTRRLKMPDGYAIHGTDNPASIGTATSHGCIRMRNEDIEQLYPIVPVGTPVYIY